MISAFPFSLHTTIGLQKIVINASKDICSTGLKTQPLFRDTIRAGVGEVTGREQLTDFLKWRTIQSRVCDELAIIIVIAQLSAFFNVTDASKTVQKTLLDIAGNIGTGTDYWGLN